MSKKASPTLVGLFVVLGAAATVVAVLLLGSGNLFSTKIPFVLYFDESVNGLQKGAPVKFKGVTIGEVREILLHYDKGNDQIHIPVIIHLNANTIMDNLSVPLHVGQEAAYVDLVNHLVGKLETDSFVTGRLYIGLHYDPASDSKRRAGNNQQYPEIPTEPSSFAALTDQLSGIDIAGIAERAKTVLDKVNTSLDELEFDRLNKEVIAVLETARKKIDSLPIEQSLAAFNGAMKSAERTLASIEKTSDELRQLSGAARGELKPLVAGLNATTTEAVSTLKEVEKTAAELRSLVSPKSPAYLKIVKALEELALLSRSIRELSDTINQDPRMFLTGRPAPESSTRK
jgi:paraquat-inducible protein B